MIGRRGLGFKESCIFSFRIFQLLYSIPGKSILKHFDENSFSETNRKKKYKTNWSIWGKLFNLVNSNKFSLVELGKLPGYCQNLNP